MPRQVSLTAMRAALAQETNEVFLELLKIEHASLGAPIYLVNNTESIVSGGNTHTPVGFRMTLPSDEAEREPTAQLVINNVDRSLMDEVRTLTSAPTVTVSVILASSPNTIEYGPVRLEVRSATYDANVITFALGFDAFFNEPISAAKFTPEYFPGLFA